LGFFRACVLALVSTLLLPAIGAAQTVSEWTSKGPFCARPFGLATAKGITAPAYMAVGGSLFRSLDAWATWSRVGAGLPASYLSDVAVSPQNARLLYFALWDGGGVFRSGDGGETWRPVFRNLPDPLVQELMVPVGPVGTVFAIAPSGGIYRSRDRGETWTDVSPPGQRPANYFQLVAHPLHPERLAARTSSGLWRSTNGGDTWTPWNAGLTSDSSGSYGLGSVTLAPGDQDIAFVTAYQTLYRSQAGRPWKRIGQIPVNSFAFVNTLLALPGAALLAGQDGENTLTTPGILRSRDGGKTWQPLSLLGETVYELSYLPAVGRVVALTRSGAFSSSDLGTTWKRTGSGVAAARVTSLAAIGAGGQVLVAGLEDCSRGIARSADGGKTWQLQETRAPGEDHGVSVPWDVLSLASAPSRPLRVYAVTTNNLLRSDNGGITWTQNGGIRGEHRAALAVHPTNPDFVFLAGQGGLSRSLDGGRTWKVVLSEYPFNDITTVVFDPGQPQRMLAASWYGGLTRSLDGGATWQPVPGTDFLRMDRIAVHPRDSNLMLASSLVVSPSEGIASLYRSVDGGSTWVPSDAGIEGALRGLTFSADGAEVVAVGDEGVFRSTDGGVDWQRVEGAPAGARAIVLPGSGILRVGTNEGVFSSVARD
jgi:photosystem II stability/assembly factor-like uncharacterized protein